MACLDGETDCIVECFHVAHVIVFKVDVYCRLFECRRVEEGYVKVGYAGFFEKSFDLVLV